MAQWIPHRHPADREKYKQGFIVCSNCRNEVDIESCEYLPITQVYLMPRTCKKCGEKMEIPSLGRYADGTSAGNLPEDFT